jgi:hypothetical protein
MNTLQIKCLMVVLLFALNVTAIAFATPAVTANFSLSLRGQNVNANAWAQGALPSNVVFAFPQKRGGGPGGAG